MRQSSLFITLFILLVAGNLFAANPGDVIINEIAWMGTDASGSDEWIELYNTTDAAIDISGWSIYGADTGVTLNFSDADGSTTMIIPAKGYLIYANEQDNVNDPVTTSIVDIWDATIGLNNSSPGQIILYDAPNGGGNEINRINQATGDWFAGDNTSKKTMERLYPNVSGTDAANWATNDGITKNGFASDNSALNGTPKAQNSPLIVTSHTPGKNEINVLATSNIQVQFSQDINVTTVNENTFNVDGIYTGEITDSYTVNSNTVTFDPTNDFEPGEVVTVTLTTGIQSTGGVSLANPYTYQFTVKAAQSCGFFAAQSIISTTDSPQNVCAADIDGDGDIDVLSTSSNLSSPSGDDDHIAWYENGGSWNKTVIDSDVIRPQCIHAADIDGDGDMDVLFASRSNADSKIAWWDNTDGNGTFGAQQVISTNVDKAYSVYTADIDGDGDLDVLSASKNDTKIAWYENGNSWNETILSETGNFGGYGVHAVDLDGDGDMDVISCSKDDDIIYWYENGNSWKETVVSFCRGY